MLLHLRPSALVFDGGEGCFEVGHDTYDRCMLHRLDRTIHDNGTVDPVNVVAREMVKTAVQQERAKNEK